jgi:hypothetical protein
MILGTCGRPFSTLATLPELCLADGYGRGRLPQQPRQRSAPCANSEKSTYVQDVLSTLAYKPKAATDTMPANATLGTKLGKWMAVGRQRFDKNAETIINYI